MTGAAAGRRGVVGAYLRDHWQGRQSLAWSFWVNLVLLRAAILGLAPFTRPPFIEDPVVAAGVAIAYFLVLQVGVFAWQIVGVVRAGDAYQSNFGAGSLVIAVHLAIVAAMALTLTSVVSVFLHLFEEPAGEPEYLAWERARAARYQLALDADDATLLRFTGSFELGVIRKLTALVQAHPGLRGIVLDSPGGHVYEGRGVAKLIQRQGLDTYVFGTCSSTCTTVFIAGKTRVLGPQGRLGFHQQWMDADYPVFLVDEEAEMRKDLDFYAAQGIAPAFRDKVFVTPHDRLWFPSPDELLAAGVVHRIAETAQ